VYSLGLWSSIILFVAGVMGFIVRRNTIVMVLCAELAIQGASLNFIAGSAKHQDYGGQIFAIFIITIAACEAALALMLILQMYKRKNTLDISVWSELGEEPYFGEEQSSRHMPILRKPDN
jgi:NADH-quinone oxidoreductase subunit K